MAGAAGLSLALLAVLGLIGFGSHAFGFVGAVSEQQQLVATHSIPAETARLVGLHGTPGWWRHCFIAGFVVVLVYALWRTAARGRLARGRRLDDAGAAARPPPGCCPGMRSGRCR